MSCHSATLHPCMVWHQVDGSFGTIAASLHRVLDVSMSCTHLMLAMRCVWLVLYVFNALPAPCAY
jgi:hypothetical protein